MSRNFHRVSFWVICLMLTAGSSFAQISPHLYQVLPDSLRPKDRNHLTIKEVQVILDATLMIDGWNKREYVEVDSICLKFAPTYITLSKADQPAFLYAICRYFYRGLNYQSGRFGLQARDGSYENPLVKIAIQYANLYIEKYEGDLAVDQSTLTNVMLHKAHFQMELGEFKAAFNMLQRALVLAKRLGRPEKIISQYTSFGHLFESLDLPNQSLVYCDSAEAVLGRVKRGQFWNSIYAYILRLRQVSYYSLYSNGLVPQYADSIRALHQNAKFIKNQQMKGRFIAESYIFESRISYQKAQYEACLANIDSAFIVFPNLLSVGNWDIAMVFKVLSLRKLGQLEESNSNLQHLNLDDYRRPIIGVLLEELYKEEVAKGNFKNALSYLERINRFQSRKLELDTEGNALEMEQFYNVRQRDLEIAQLNELQRRNLLIGVFMFVIILLIVAILLIRYRANVTKTNNLVNQLEEAAQLQVLKLEDAREEERKILGQYLHDGLSSTIAGIRNRMELVILDNKDSVIQDQLDKIFNEVVMAYEMARAKSHAWFKGSGQTREMSFAVQIQTLADSALPSNSYTKEISVDAGGLNHVSIETRIELLRIIQEALINVVKHANAKAVSILIYEDNGEIYLVVKDNGRGFNQDKINSVQSGIGLYSIRERVKRINGILDINSGDDGTEIVVSFPI